MMSINKRRTYGEHLTPIQIFKKYILPEIQNQLYNYIWVDLFAGKGNLILPILELIPQNKRIEFFRKHIYLFDIQKKLVKLAIQNATKYGIPKEIAEQNIIQRDTIKNYPTFILDSDLPVYHITNPPYLYIGYIVKHKETQKYLKYFVGKNEGYQDLYQLGLMNDLRFNINKMIYIVPSNFLFGYSISNKIRNDFFKYYKISKAIIFEKEIFEYTGTNVMLCYFERKNKPEHKIFSFKGTKINKYIQKKIYTLSPENYYRAGNIFENFINEFKANSPLKINFYLTLEEVEQNKGNLKINVIDANKFNGKEYQKSQIYVNKKLYNKIKSNILFIRTVDTGSSNGKAGLYKIYDIFQVEGILVSRAKYRTHPIQIFIEPLLSYEEQILLMNYFNLLLEYFRKKTDSEFLTTYKYSNSEYTRKYLGLSQTKKLIYTFPWLKLTKKEKTYLKFLITNKEINKIITFIKNHK
ncbi:MAG: hypothetical protein KatS3mg068_2734 [Candidatus Sericytochromatia bacterium]|nr:MAG: hypothetical protein KatS3mg068_2734 [Candidatus Sericytochromatia bacterium]